MVNVRAQGLNLAKCEAASSREDRLVRAIDEKSRGGKLSLT